MRRAAFAALLLLASACDDDDPLPSPSDGSVIGGDALALDGAPSLADATPSLSDGGADRDAGTSTTTGRDGGSRPDSGILDDCNPVTQDCADPADKCVIEAQTMPPIPTEGTTCIDREPGDKARGAVCGGSDCEAGLVCVNTGTVARCLLACDRGSGDPCSTLGADYDCRLGVRGTNWGACEQLPPICDPLTLAPCTMAQSCVPVRRFDGTFEFRCRPAGTATEGQACDATACARGLVCVREDGMAKCRKPCGDDSGCAMPQTCIGVVQGVKYCR